MARRLVATGFVGLAIAALAPASQAHFALQSPPAMTSQDGFGSPQKLGPCGNEPGGTPTNAITAYQSGQTITVTINEIIYHPGHYRVALAVNDPSELPPEPIVTPNSTPCGTVPIASPAVFPVLADGVLIHTAPFSGPQSFEVTLPANVTCTKCTLQVLEFMSDHPLNNPGGCFYHHCANISLQSTPVDAGPPDAGASSTPSAPAGCACSTLGEGGPATGALGAMLAFAAAFGLRRRKRAQSRA